MKILGMIQMKRKKGFIFIETLIVIAVLTLSLLMTYSAYNGAVAKENIRIHYDDAAYMYRTYYITRFLKDFNLNIVKDYLNKENNKYLFYLKCQDSALFYGRENNKDLCDNIWNQFHISNIYITFENLQDLQKCNNNNNMCQLLNLIYPEDAANYLKTIGGKEDDGYRIIIEYKETKDGEVCTDDNKKCEYHYTTLSLGEIT